MIEDTTITALVRGLAPQAGVYVIVLDDQRVSPDACQKLIEQLDLYGVRYAITYVSGDPHTAVAIEEPRPRG